MPRVVRRRSRLPRNENESFDSIHWGAPSRTRSAHSRRPNSPIAAKASWQALYPTRLVRQVSCMTPHASCRRLPIHRVERSGSTHDSAQRPVSQTEPDGRVIGIAYDANGNITSLTPPGRSAHAFAYNAVDLLTACVPPLTSAEGRGKRCTHTTSIGELTQVTRPDGPRYVRRKL